MNRRRFITGLLNPDHSGSDAQPELKPESRFSENRVHLTKAVQQADAAAERPAVVVLPDLLETEQAPVAAERKMFKVCTVQTGIPRHKVFHGPGHGCPGMVHRPLTRQGCCHMEYRDLPSFTREKSLGPGLRRVQRSGKVSQVLSQKLGEGIEVADAVLLGFGVPDSVQQFLELPGHGDVRRIVPLVGRDVVLHPFG